MQKRIGLWLLACSGLVWIILVTGGVTRLTHSGLSIVEWHPVVGAVPPLNRAQWQEEFRKYKLSPEYRDINIGMSLDSFESIYLMEYAHRLLARIAGLAFVLPLLYFSIKERIDRALIPKLTAIALLWALQGALGWYMVASGLVNQPHVSHYRLTAHLLTACLLYAAMLSTAFGLLRPAAPGEAPPPSWLARAGGALVAYLFLLIGSGGLVAGLRAGFASNTFPRMNGYWIPPYMLSMRPLALNVFDNLTTVQFDHRVLAELLVLMILGLWAAGLRAGLPKRCMNALHLLAFAVLLQASLGILTLINGVPVPLAAAHQGMALLLLGAALLLRHEATAVARRP